MPRASRDGLQGLYGDRLKVRLTAQPVAGEANEALVRFFSKLLRVPARRIRIVAGIRERSKTLLLECDDPVALGRALHARVAEHVDKHRDRN